MGMGYFLGPLMLGALLAVVIGARIVAGGRSRGGYREPETTRRASRRAPADPGLRARELLAERYARGDLDTEEYRERLHVLEQRD